MRKIKKGCEPESLTRWKRDNPNSRYGQLDPDVRREIREHALKEQFFLCAHCCQAIKNLRDGHNEHIEAQSLNQNRTLDFSNIVVSCNTLSQCGKSHNSQPLPLTPLMYECEEELKFKISGRVEGRSDRATTTIRVLNLGDSEIKNRSIIEKRKQLAHALLLVNGVDSNEGLEDEGLLTMLIDDLSQPKDGRLEAFAPVVVNILRSWLPV